MQRINAMAPQQYVRAAAEEMRVATGRLIEEYHREAESWASWLFEVGDAPMQWDGPRLRQMIDGAERIRSRMRRMLTRELPADASIERSGRLERGEYSMDVVSPCVRWFVFALNLALLVRLQSSLQSS